jgi:hypothetical protein
MAAVGCTALMHSQTHGRDLACWFKLHIKIAHAKTNLKVKYIVCRIKVS